MDLFNKNKVKKLENEIKKLNDTLECVQLDRNDLQKDNERLRKLIEESNIKIIYINRFQWKMKD